MNSSGILPNLHFPSPSNGYICLLMSYIKSLSTWNTWSGFWFPDRALTKEVGKKIYSSTNIHVFPHFLALLQLWGHMSGSGQYAMAIWDVRYLQPEFLRIMFDFPATRPLRWHWFHILIWWCHEIEISRLHKSLYGKQMP